MARSRPKTKPVTVLERSARAGGPEIRARPFSAEVDGGTRIHNLLSPAEQADLAEIATVLEFRAAGATIYSEGEDAHFLYAVATGFVRVSRHEETGERRIIAFMWAGDLLGLAERGRYVNSAETGAATTLYRFPLRALRRLLLRKPQLQLHLLVKAAHDLRMAQRQLIVLGYQDASRRLASLLLDLSQHHEFFDTENRILRLPMTRFDIADYLGMAPETVARAFARLEREGVVSRVSPKTVRIPDLEALMPTARAARIEDPPRRTE
jgi:CRP-like cAMP-binding protein